MPDYEKLYYKMFTAMSDILEAIESMNFGTAKEILIKAQQEAEELYISADEK